MPSYQLEKQPSTSSTSSSSSDTMIRRTQLLPTENFENTLPDGIITINAFEICDSKYDQFVSSLQSRLIEICAANPWLLGRLEQTRSISITSPLKGDYDLVYPSSNTLSPQDLKARILTDIFEESPNDLPWWNTLEGSPLADLMKFVVAATSSSKDDTSTPSNTTTGLNPNNLPGRTYQDLSKLLKTTTSTGIPTGPESAKAGTSLCRVVVLPTPTRSHAFVVLALSHAIADGNTYHRILHMLLGSTDRRTGEVVEIQPLLHDIKDCSEEILAKLPADIETNMIKNYKKERDTVVPEAKLLDQIKLGLDIGRSAVKEQILEGRSLQSFVALVNLEEINRLKQEYANRREEVFGDDDSQEANGNGNSKAKNLSTNDILVCELSKILNVDRIDTNMDVRIPVLSQRMGAPKEAAANAAGNFVAMLPFFRPHFENPWYVRKAMTRGDNTFAADPVQISKSTNLGITGNLSNWSGFTVGTQLAGGIATTSSGGAKLLLHLPINVTASNNTPFEQALVFCPFQDQPKQLAVIFSTHRYQKLLANIEQHQTKDDRRQPLLIPFVKL